MGRNFQFLTFDSLLLFLVSLSAFSGLSFISFMLALDPESSEGEDDPNALGSFEIADLAETRFSPRCANLVENMKLGLQFGFKTSLDPSSMEKFPNVNVYLTGGFSK